MKRNIIIAIIMIVIIAQVTTSQELHQLRVVDKPKLLQEGFVSSDIKDANGRICAAIMIVSDLKGFAYESNNGVVKVKRTPGQDVVYVSPDERMVEVYVSGFEPLKIIMAEYGINLEPSRIWKFKITGEKKLAEIPISIITEQNGVEKLIDGKPSGAGKSFILSAGKHTVKLQKNGYKSLTKEIAVSESNTLFEFSLQEVEQQLLTIKSTPDEAQIFIDDIEVGRTNKQVFRYPGQYRLKLTKSKYETIDEVITVTEGGNNTFSYTLIKTTAILTIITNPPDADIYLNNEKKTSKTLEVSPGQHKIEVKKEGYFPESRTVTIGKGQDQTETFTLRQKTGSLQVVVEPMETKVVLKRANRQVDSWTGSKKIKELPVGEYDLQCTASGYRDQNKNIAIILEQTGILDIKMEKGRPFSSDQKVPDNKIFVEGGTFTMGSNDGDDDEKPPHIVTLSSFYIGKYEVTQREWREVMGNNPSHLKGDDLAIEYVNWYGVVEYCNSRSKKEGLTPCYTKDGKSVTCDFNANGYRLPTEAEWEYAARGGNKSRGYKYSGSDNIKDAAWYVDNSNEKTHRARGKKPNELGIYDMTGNVCEWCWDWYGSYSSSSATDPKGSSSGKRRILRGGSWSGGAKYCRTAYRNRLVPDLRSDGIGFRVVVSSFSVKSP